MNFICKFFKEIIEVKKEVYYSDYQIACNASKDKIKFFVKYNINNFKYFQNIWIKYNDEYKKSDLFIVSICGEKSDYFVFSIQTEEGYDYVDTFKTYKNTRIESFLENTIIENNKVEFLNYDKIIEGCKKEYENSNSFKYFITLILKPIALNKIL